LNLISNWVAIGSLQLMQESPREPTTAQTNVSMCLFIQETSRSTSNTFLTRYRSGGTPMNFNLKARVSYRADG
jgi:hypothetical protein